MRKIASVTIALIVVLSLTACGTGRFKASASVLPDVVEYTKETQTTAAGEMDQHCGEMPVVCDTMLPDYKVMRDQTRAAKKALK